MIIRESILLGSAFLICLPFGYWRANTDKLTRDWILAIHIPVPFIFLLRHELNLSILIIPFSALFFALGQFSGGLIGKTTTKSRSSCLIMDLARTLFPQMR